MFDSMVLHHQKIVPKMCLCVRVLDFGPGRLQVVAQFKAACLTRIATSNHLPWMATSILTKSFLYVHCVEPMNFSHSLTLSHSLSLSLSVSLSLSL